MLGSVFVSALHSNTNMTSEFLTISFTGFSLYIFFAIIDIKISVKDIIGKRYNTIILKVEGADEPYYVKLENYKKNYDSVM